MRRKHALIAAAIVACALVALIVGDRSSTRGARADAEQLLRSVLHDGVSQPMRGTGTVGTHVGSQFATSEATIDFAGRASRARLGDSGEPMTLVDDGERVWKLSEEKQEAVSLHASDRQVDWDLLDQNYRVIPHRARRQTRGGARGIRLVNRHSGETALELTIDPETRLILSRRTYDADGHLVGSTELTQTAPAPELGPEDVSVPRGWRRQTAEDLGKPVTLDEFVAGADFTPQYPAYLPPGYRQAGLYSHICPHGRAYVELRYTDGLRTLTVYEHRPRGGGRGMGQGRGPGGGKGLGKGPGRGRGGGAGGGGGMGGGHHGLDRQPVLIDQGQAKSVRYRREDLRIIVTGDLTSEEILKVVDSIPHID